jgi:hypothetical protein
MAQPNTPFDATTNDTPAPPANTAGLLPTEAAYDTLLPEILAVPESELLTMNIDVMSAIITVTGVLPEIKSLRAEIEAALRTFDLVQFDKLEQYTLALSHAHSRHRSAIPTAGLLERVTDLSSVRDQLLASASSLASVRLIDGERLKNVKKVTGYRALASDVLTLCTVLKEEWPRVEGKTPFTQADLVRISTLALEFVNVIGLREQAPVIAGEAALIRQKAFTLFVRAYDEARRAVHYLRAKAGDGESIAPSLYAGRGGRRRTGEEPAVVPPTVVATPTTGAATSAAKADPSANAPAAPIVFDNAAGLPLDHPFAS